MANHRRGLVSLVAFMLCLLILLVAVFNHAAAADSAAFDSAPVLVPGVDGTATPLVVPVYPHLRKPEDTPESTDLRDSYIVLEDGAVISMADWLLGALNKDTGGLAMSDLQERLFLGKVARSLAGLDPAMVSRTPVPGRVVGLRPALGPGVVAFGPFQFGQKPSGPNSALQAGVARGLYSLNDSIGTDRSDEMTLGKLGLLENPYETAFANSVEDYKLRGTLQNMLRDYQKRVSDNPSAP